MLHRHTIWAGRSRSRLSPDGEVREVLMEGCSDPPGDSGTHPLGGAAQFGCAPPMSRLQ
jgi:hypothetical protein